MSDKITPSERAAIAHFLEHQTVTRVPRGATGLGEPGNWKAQQKAAVRQYHRQQRIKRADARARREGA